MSEGMVIVNEVDKQGRLVLPREWCEKYLKEGVVRMRFQDDTIEIAPYKAVDLTKYFDCIEVDIKTDLADWRAVRR